jgi:hypothetical protein
MKVDPGAGGVRMAQDAKPVTSKTTVNVTVAKSA